MTLLDKFRAQPRDKHPDPSVRLAYVEEIPLTEREASVLRLIASGYSNKEIAARLDLSVKTVEAHKANAMRKLDMKGRIDIVKYSVLQGWLDNS